MTDRQKSYILGYVKGYEEKLVRTVSYEVGIPAFSKLMDSIDYEVGMQNGEFDGEKAGRGIVYEDRDDFSAGTYGEEFKESIIESLKNDGPVFPDFGAGFTQPPEYPLYLDTQVTDLCEDFKDVLSKTLLSAKMGSGFVSTDVLEDLYDQIDLIEQKLVMEQVDDYYGR